MPRSPLHGANTDLGARFVDFAGWDMPVQYDSVVAEHMAVRAAAGVFDVSHLGRFSIAGPGTSEVLQPLLCNDATSIGPGRAQYTMALNPAGGVIDDIIIWRFDEESYWVLPNGANHDEVLAAFVAAAPATCDISGLQTTTAMLAVQGPESGDVLERVLGTRPGRFRVGTASFAGSTVSWAGTGYTGERGAEVCIAADGAEALFTALQEAGARPCGLGARDTLRLEMGYPLWGQDLDAATTPLEAGLDWVVSWDHDFIGRPALDAQRREGVPKRLIGFEIAGRQIPRHHYQLRAGGSTGVVTSGNYSPMLERGIGMGYLAPDPGPGLAEVEIEVRGSWVPARTVDPPFIRKD